MKKNCRITSFFVFGSYVKIIIIIFFVIVVVHGNLAWDFTMLVGDIKHQQNQNQINSQCSNFGPNCMDLYYSNLREHWQSFYSFLTQDLLPKWAPAELPPEASLVTSQRKSWFPQNCASCLWPWQRGFPPPPGIHKGKFSPVVEKMNLTQISDIFKRETGSVLPLWYVLVIFFLRLSVTLTYLFIFYGTQWGGSNASM